MSAFVVDNTTMQRCVAAICARDQWGQIIATFDGLPTEGYAHASEIGRRLFTLNIEAVQQRYPDTLDKPDDMPGPCDDDGKSTALQLATEFQFKGDRSLFDLVQGLKALQCLSYQCSEGDVDKTPLYADLQRAISRVAQQIVSELPAYNAAEWG